MRMLRVRFKLWGLMVAVAIAALSIAGSIEASRLHNTSRRHVAIAARHSELERWHRGNSKRTRWDASRESGLAAAYERDHASAVDNDFFRRWLMERAQWHQMSAELDLARTVRSDRLAEYHAALTAKYERAARRPWLPVEPDPPWPDQSIR